MNNNALSFLGPVLLVAFFIAIFLIARPAKQLHEDSITLKELKEDNAEINHIKYGLFNLGLWKNEISDLLSEQINKFEISDKARREIRSYLINYLDSFYKKQIKSGELIDQFLGDQGDGKKEFEVFGFKVKVPIKDIIKKELDGALANMDVSKTINNIADQLMLELKRNEPVIREALQGQLSELIGNQMQGDGPQFNPEKLQKKYNCADFNACQVFLSEEISRLTALEEEAKLNLFLVYMGILFILVVLAFAPVKLGLLKWIIVPGITILSLLMLALGLTLPMIDLYAGLENVKFNFMNKEVNFGEQVMFYQSKSILEVVDILLEGRSWDSKLVGYLILVFSIIFPIIKTTATFLMSYIKSLADNKFLQTIALNLSKWSMADVFVVALFMAYIGFNSVIESQILDLGDTSETYDIITKNKTVLRPGAIFFTGFVIASLCLSTIITWKKKITDYN